MSFIYSVLCFSDSANKTWLNNILNNLYTIECKTLSHDMRKYTNIIKKGNIFSARKREALLHTLTFYWQYLELPTGTQSEKKHNSQKKTSFKHQ